MRFAAARHDPVVVWELGNEVNAFEFLHGAAWRVDGARYALDHAAARAVVHAEMPGARVAGPASAYWPILGEIRPILPAFLEAAGDNVDIVSWHYYPQQSSRCPVAVRRAGPTVMLDPAHLDDVGRWARELRALQQRRAPHAEVWVSESGNAQCGGEAGVSDSFAGSFWWLDELGTLARAGVKVVARQTLSGSDYGLLDEHTLAPRPDYWVSLLWKRRMGDRVLDVDVVGDGADLRVYAHCGKDGGVALAYVNVADEDIAVALGDVDGALVDVVTAASLASGVVDHNGRALALAEDDALPTLTPAPLSTPWSAPARSLGFITLPHATAPACAR